MSVRGGTRAAATWVAKAWRKSWNRPRANTAWRNAVLKRFRRVLSSSGPPSPGGRTPGRRPRRSGGGESRARARWRADCPAGGTDRTRLRRTEALPYVVALNADATLEPVHVTPAQPEQLPRPRPARAAATTSTRSWRPPRYPGTLGAGPRARRGRGSGSRTGAGRRYSSRSTGLCVHRPRRTPWRNVMPISRSTARTRWGPPPSRRRFAMMRSTSSA
jgi:hypothetical protein